MKIKVNINLKKKRWIMKWTKILRKDNEIWIEHNSWQKYYEFWNEYKSFKNMIKFEVSISLQKILWNLKWIYVLKKSGEIGSDLKS